MKLIIKREQAEKRGLLGGHKGMRFLLAFRVELTPEEKDLVTKYRAEDTPLIFATDKAGNSYPKYTVKNLIQGSNEIADDVTILLNYEEELKKACQTFKTLLEVMASFGGEETFEF